MSWTSEVVRTVLPNGLTVLVERHAAAPVIAVVTHVKAGYFDEPDEWVGIAHVLEHMYFKGTERRGPGDIARETQLVGGYVNAGTIYDKTVYYTVLPSNAGGLDRALDIQADALMHSALDAGEVGRELEVIIQEANRKLDTPAAVAGEGLYELLFQAHRMRRWRIGTEQELRRLTAADVREYYTTRYAPERVTVSVVGDLDCDRTLELLNETFGAWSRPAVPVEGSPPEQNGRAPRVRVRNGDVKRPLANLGWRTVGTLHPDAAALDAAATILGAGRGSRLHRAVRMPGFAASAHAFHYTPTEVGVLEIALESEPESLEAAVHRSIGLVASLACDGPAPEELERTRALTATQWARRLEGADGRAAVFSEAEALGGYTLADELYERALSVTADDVRRVVAEYLDPSVACGELYLPEGVSTGLVDEWPPRPSPLETEVPAVRIGSEQAEATGPGADTISPYAGGVSHRRTEGADLLVVPRPGTGLVTVLLYVPGLKGEETLDTAGLSWLLVRSALRGAGGHTGEELAQAAELLGGGLGPGVGRETLGWGMTVRADAARRAAELLRGVALEAELLDEQVALERELQVSDARRVRDDMFRYPLQRALNQAFPDDPYGLPALGEPDLVARLSGRMVRDWAGELALRRAVVVVVGDLERDALFDACEPLTGWPGRMAWGDGEPTPGWTPGRGAEERDKKQTALAMAFPAPPFSSPDRYPLTVLRALLSGLAGRLFDELRERRSLAYTVAALPWMARRSGAVLGYIATSPDREEEARESMLAELARVTAEPPTPDELERARNYAAGSVDVQRQHGRAVAAEVLEAWVYGALGEFAEVSHRLREVSTADVVRVASEVFQEDRRAEYVVRGNSADVAPDR
jgi:zinc protease